MQTVHLYSGVLLVAATILSGALAKIVVTKCILARELHLRGVPMAEVPDFACIAQYTTNFTAEAIGPFRVGGTRGYGIFQISNEWWCESLDRPSSNGCKMSCQDLIADDLSKTIECARMIRDEQGLSAWDEWKKYCQIDKPSVDECFTEQERCIMVYGPSNVL